MGIVRSPSLLAFQKSFGLIVVPRPLELTFEAFDRESSPLELSQGWASNKHGVYESHIPECFTFVRFVTEAVDDL